MKLSIITINYNNADGLRNTMNSVSEQTWQDFEHIVIDGNSSDGSVELIKSYNYDNLIWVSEPDSGIYNAMNKGIDKAQGKYILFLNSGDFLSDSDVLSKFNNHFVNDYSIISGCVIFDENGGERLKEAPDEVSFSYLVSNYIAHPSTFIKRELFNKYGNYEEKFGVVSDWAFFLKVLGIHNVSYHKTSIVVSVFDANGLSSKEENFERIYEERLEVLKAYFPKMFSNRTDQFIFNKFLYLDKRTKYLMIIEDYPFFRKLTSAFLATIVHVIKLFKPSK